MVSEVSSIFKILIKAKFYTEDWFGRQHTYIDDGENSIIVFG